MAMTAAIRDVDSAGVVTVAARVVSAAVAGSIVGVPAGNAAVLIGTQRPTGPVTVTGCVVVAAVGRAIVEVPAHLITVLIGAQRPAVVVTHTGFVAVSAVIHPAVEVPARLCAVLVGTGGNGGLNIPLVSAAPPAMAAMGGNRHEHRSGQHNAQQTGNQMIDSSHGKRHSLFSRLRSSCAAVMI